MPEVFAYDGLLHDGIVEARAVLHGFSLDESLHPTTVVPDSGSSVEGRLVRVDDIGALDRYQGVRRDDEESLYWRLEHPSGVHVYVGNPAAASRQWEQAWNAAYTMESVTEALTAAELEVNRL